jgi:DNA transformation protein and related proteins
MATDQNFADYCCELLSSCGPCVSKRMFGGYGISTQGLTLAIIADLGAGQKLWLKADDSTRGQYEAAGCARFIYPTEKNGVAKNMSMNYYSAPEDAMESSDAMRRWAAVAMDCAVRAKAGKRGSATGKSKFATKSVATSQATPSKLSHTVLERAREAAQKTALSPTQPTAKPKTPLAKRAAAPAAKPKAARKSAKGSKTAAQ